MKEFVKKYKVVSKVKGFSSLYLKIDGKKYWNIHKFQALEMYLCNKCLPSDATYRKDVNYLLLGDMKTAEDSKHELEELQRKDKRLREENKPTIEDLEDTILAQNEESTPTTSATE